MSAAKSTFTWIGSRLLTSFLSVLAGWSGGMVFFILFYLWGLISSVLAHSGNVDWPYEFEGLLIIGYYMGVVVGFVWMVLVLPLFLFVPSGSKFWRRGIITFVGVLSGPLLIMILTVVEGARNGVPITERLNPNLAGILFFGVPTVIVGGITGFVGSIFNRRLQG